MKRFIFLLLIGLGLLLPSCTPKLIDTSCAGYQRSDFNRSKINAHGIGIMPVLGGGQKEELRRPMGDAINRQFSYTFGGDKVRPTYEVVTKLNEEKLADEYAVAILNYQTSGIVPKEMVQQLGTALGVKYLVYTRLFDEAKYLKMVGSFHSKVKDAVLVEVQVWDAEVGDVGMGGQRGGCKPQAFDQ